MIVQKLETQFVLLELLIIRIVDIRENTFTNII